MVRCVTVDVLCNYMPPPSSAHEPHLLYGAVYRACGGRLAAAALNNADIIQFRRP